MKRLFPLFALVLVVGCNKPSDEMCRKAIRNMRSLLGTDSPTNQTDISGDVRRCKGGSTKKAVECAAKATTLDELRACDFMKVPLKPAGSDTTTPPAGSGTATTGSMSGSDSMGSATTGSATGAGSATGSAAGSATGSAAGSSAGSATGSTTGSATGSAMGSSAGSATGSAAGSAK